MILQKARLMADLGVGGSFRTRLLLLEAGAVRRPGVLGADPALLLACISISVSQAWQILTKDDCIEGLGGIHAPA